MHSYETVLAYNRKKHCLYICKWPQKGEYDLVWGITRAAPRHVHIGQTADNYIESKRCITVHRRYTRRITVHRRYTRRTTVHRRYTRRITVHRRYTRRITVHRGSLT